MADEKETADAAAAASPSRKRALLSLLMLVAVAVIFGAAGFAVPLLFPQLVGGEVTDEVSTDPPPRTEPSFINFGEVVVNLNSDRFNRYLRVNLTLQIDKEQEEELTKHLESNKAILKSWLLSYLSDQAMDEIRGAAGQNRLRREIQNQFNTVLSPDGYDRIDDVLFEEFSVQ